MEIRTFNMGLGCRGKTVKDMLGRTYCLVNEVTNNGLSLDNCPLQSSKGTAALGVLQKLV